MRATEESSTCDDAIQADQLARHLLIEGEAPAALPARGPTEETARTLTAFTSSHELSADPHPMELRVRARGRCRRVLRCS